MAEDTVSLSRMIDSHEALLSQLSALEALAHDLQGRPGPAGLENLDEAIVLLRSRLGALMRDCSSASSACTYAGKTSPISGCSPTTLIAGTRHTTG